MKLRIGILGSTRGTASQGVFEAVEGGEIPAEVALVISNRADALILDRAARYGAPNEFLDSRGLARESYDAYVTAALTAADVQLVLLAGYMRILSPTFVAAWRGRLLNVHPSLLPAFAGLMDRAVHEAVLRGGVTETGCTVHEVTEEVDAGPIVLQKRCAVLPDDTVESLRDRVQALEQEAFVDVLRSWKA